jgi:hypothetical protein
MVSRGVHDCAFIPIDADFAADTLSVLDPDPFCLFGIWQVGVIHYPEQNDGRVLFCRIGSCLRTNARREEEAQRRDTPDLLPVKVVDLKDGVVIAKGHNLTHVRLFINERTQSLASGVQRLR